LLIAQQRERIAIIEVSGSVFAHRFSRRRERSVVVVVAVVVVVLQ